MNFTTKICILAILFLILGCKEHNFTKNAWNTKDDKQFPFRPKIVDDLIEKGILIGKNKDEVIDLLGSYDYTETTNTGKIQKISYFVMDKYGLDIDPQYSITLILEIDTNKSTVNKALKFETVDRRSLLEKIFCQ